MSTRKLLVSAYKRSQRSFTSAPPSGLSEILAQVRDGTLNPSDAEALIKTASDASPEEAIKRFANLDHTRTSRTGFPEAVFAAGKTPDQVAKILDDMARHVNEQVETGNIDDAERAILATR